MNKLIISAIVTSALALTSSASAFEHFVTKKITIPANSRMCLPSNTYYAEFSDNIFGSIDGITPAESNGKVTLYLEEYDSGSGKVVQLIKANNNTSGYPEIQMKNENKNHVYRWILASNSENPVEVEFDFYLISGSFDHDAHRDFGKCSN